MSQYAISCFVSSISSMILGLFVYFKNANGAKNKVWALLSLAIVVWTFGQFQEAVINNELVAFRWNKFLLSGVIFIPVFFLNFMLVLQDLVISHKKGLYVSYAITLIFLTLLHNNMLIKGVIYRPPFGYYSDPTPTYIAFFVFFIVVVVYAFFVSFQNYQNLTKLNKLQLRYTIFASIIGFSAGTFNFLPAFNIPTTPFVNYIFSIYPIVITYAILRYRLMDVSIVVTRTGIFVAVYTFVLGIPFALAFAGREKLLTLFGSMWWMVPLVTSTVLATVGPFIYVYVQSRAEERLFQEQKRYQTTLRQASTGMGKIKDLKKLVTLIVHIMTRTVRVEFSMVFLNDQHGKKFRMGAYRSREERVKFRGDIDYDTAIVQFLQETQSPIVYEEIKQRAQDYNDLKLARLEAELKALDAAIVVPSFVDEKLLAILVMGNKISGKMYTSDDLTVFSILANQSALAIENAQFYEDMKMTHAQLMKAEKMATIGILADGLSHQINNRLHAMGFIAGDALDTIKLRHNLPMSLEVKEVMLDLEHALNRIESNVQQGGEIVQGLLKYSRKDDESITAVALDKLVAAALDMTQFKIKPGEMSVQQDYPHDLPAIRGNFTQLQEVFFNLIDNAYDAMIQRKNELKEPGYSPMIKIMAKPALSGQLEIVFEDNGVGIRDDDKEKIFTPFFTTKLSSKKGTGLGLYVIQRLIEENHKGTVRYESVYKQGTKVYISLPTSA